MKLLIMHGPPAAGKLTVAREIERVTSFKVFHNHLSIDCVKPVFEFGTPPFGRLIERIRVETIAEAAREGVDLIHTFVYAAGEDDEHFEKLIAAAETNGGEVHLVLLKCDPDELKARIGNESRQKIGKLTDPESVDRSLNRMELLSTLPGRETLVIDTTERQPEDTAALIIQHFNLQRSNTVESIDK